MKIVKFQINVKPLKSWKSEKEEKVDNPKINKNKNKKERKNTIKINIYRVISTSYAMPITHIFIK
jgi:hypothetical protein